MTYTPTAKAMTAIAAALAFTSAPSFAQDTGAAPDISTETPAAADPLAPEPVAEQVPAAPEAAPPPAPKPKVETTRAKAASAAPAKSAKPAKASSSTARPTVSREATAVGAAAPVAPLTEAAAAAPLPATPPPAVAEPAPPPVAEPAPAGGTAGALMADIMADDRLPYAGGAALGLLALGGAGLVSRRRKRRRENEAFEARQQFLDSAESEPGPPVLELDRSAEVRAGPAFARTAPVHDPVPQRASPAVPVADAPTTEIPEGFDLSRFGPHVQAAYRGPTEDNPSLSLKYRLRRGAALDQQERNAAEQVGSARTEAPASVPTRGKWESRPDAHFLFRRADRPAEREVEPS